MATVYETIVGEDLNLGHGSATITNPAGGTLTGSKIGLHTFMANYMNAADFSAANGGAQVAAAIAALPSAGGVVDARELQGAQTVSTRITIDRPLILLLGASTWTTTVADPGQFVGSMFELTTDDVRIEGIGPATILKKTGASDQQALISLAANNRITIKNLKMNGDEANHTTRTSKYYTLIVSRAGSSDIVVDHCELTGGGNRAIDLRGFNRCWIKNNYFYQNGIATIGGTALDGNALSLDADGTTYPTDAWVEDNIFEEWGDSISFVTGNRAHFRNNTLRGRADFGNAPLTTESGIDLTGSTNVDVIGNLIFNVRGVSIGAVSIIPGATFAVENIRIADNILSSTAAGLASYDPRVQLGQGGTATQAINISYCNNSHRGVSLDVAGIDGFICKGNSFFNTSTTATTAGCIDLGQTAGGVMRNFVISDNSFDTDNATLTRAINVGSAITTPGAAFIVNNAVNHANVTVADITFQSSAALNKIVTRSARVMTIDRSSADTTGAALAGKKSRGTNSAPTAVTTGDELLDIEAWGHDGTSHVKAMLIRMDTEGTIATGIVPGIIRFYTMDSTGSLIERLDLPSAGGLLIGAQAAAVAAPTGASNKVGIGTQTSTTIGANGAASALTANPVGYLKITVGGTARQIPFYNV